MKRSSYTEILIKICMCDICKYKNTVNINIKMFVYGFKLVTSVLNASNHVTPRVKIKKMASTAYKITFTRIK